MKLYKKIVTIALALSAVSCENFFDKTPENMLAGEDEANRSIIYASFMGLIGTLQDAVPKLVVSSELHGDLMIPTDQAPESYWELFRYDVHTGNEVASPAPLYRIVMNCNDFLRNTIAYNNSYPGVLPVNTYKQMIAGAVTLRSWAYLNIGKLYGKAVYYDYAMTGEVDLSKLPVYTLDELVPVLIDFMNVGVDNINGIRRVDIDQMFDVSGNLWRALPIAPDALMCELYLWSKDYEMAAKRGINLLTGQGVLVAGDLNKLTCSYMFGKSSGTGRNPWHTLFSETTVDKHFNEGLSIVLYSAAQRQFNPLYKLCSADPSGQYYVKPSQVTTLNLYTGSGVTSGDPRGLDVSIGTQNGQSVFTKYSYKRDITKQDSPIYIYRAAEVHLMIIEALNALGNYEAADALLNNGIAEYWQKDNVFRPPFDAPIYAVQKLKGNQGIRGRVEINPIHATDSRFMGNLVEGTDEYKERRRQVLDSLIVQETGRELLCEGKRWFTLLRIARNNDRPELLADLTSRKFPAGERPLYRELLMDRKSWFIDYDLDLNNASK